MDRYIDADKLLEYLEKEAEREDVKYSFIGLGVQATINEIKKFPLEDVAPVIHAHWEYRYDTGIYQTEFLCSRCKGLIETYSCTVDEVEYEYCPHCGAKMDEEV